MLASLWKVDDEATADLMVEFHRRLRAGDRTSRALRLAQLEMIRGRDDAPHYAEPYYWAGFQLIGAE